MTENQAQSQRFWPEVFGIEEEEELEELRMEIALEERDCVELLWGIGAEELPRTRQPEAPRRNQVRVIGGTWPFRKANTPGEVFEKEPSSRIALSSNNVHVPTEFQRTAWPVLLQNSDTLLLAPREAGKFMSLLPIITKHALKSRVIIASTRKRCMDYYRALINIPRMSPSVTEITIGRKLEANIVACPFTALPEVAQREEKIVCVLDGLDKLAEQGPTCRLREILSIVNEKSTRVLATARTSSAATVELTRKIGIKVVVSTDRTDVTELNHAAETRIEMCSRAKRYAVLKRYLKDIDISSARVLIFAKNKKAANILEKTLCDHDIYAQSLHAEADVERDLADNLLRSGNPGVFIVIARDFSWLQDIPRVDLLIDLQSVKSPSGFSMRENRVRASGIFVVFVSATDLQAASWIVPLFRLRNKPIRTELLRLYAVHNNLTLWLPEH